MSTTSSIWTAAEQPLFNAWESMAPVDEFYQHEPRFEQWYRDLYAQDEAQRHYMILFAALTRHQQRPTPPKCLTAGDVALIYTPSPLVKAEPLQDFEDMRAAVEDIRSRRRAATI